MLYKTISKLHVNFTEQHDNYAIFCREEAVRMKKAKTVTSSDSSRKIRSALSPEARENQMISLAMDLAEQQLRDGTASSQLITEFVKRGSTKSRIEQEILEEQKELMAAKKESLQSAKRVEELYENAIKAMRRYSGHGDS